MNAFEVVGQYVINGVDQAVQAVDRVNSAAEASAKQFQAAGQRVTDFGDATQRAGTTLTKYVTGTVAAVGGSLFLMAQNVAATSDAILDLSAASGLTTDEVQRWRYVAQAAGTDADAMADGLDRMQRQMGTLTNETTAGGQAMQQLGIDTDRFFSARPDARAQMLVDAFSRIQDPVRRAELGTALFSRRWSSLAPILDMGADRIGRIRDESERYLISQEQLQKAGDDYRNGINSLRNELDHMRTTMGLAFIDMMQDTIIPFLQNHGIPLMETLVGAITGAMEAFSALPGPMQAAIIQGIALAAALGPVLFIGGKLISMFGGLIKLLGTLAPLKIAAGVAVAKLLLPVVALIAAVTAVVAIFRNWELVTRLAGAAWQGLQNLLASGAAWLSSVFAGAWDYVSGRVSEFGARVLQTLRTAWTSALQSTSDFIRNVLSWFANLPGQIAQAIRELPRAVWQIFINMAQGMMQIVRDAVSNVIGSFRDMFMAIVGNSIVPDMRVGVLGEFKGMVGETDALSASMARNVTGNLDTLDGVSGGLAAAHATPAGRQQGGGSQTTVVDMRHAVIRDDRDLVDRLQRRGVGTLGGLV